MEEIKDVAAVEIGSIKTTVVLMLNQNGDKRDN